MKKLLLILIIVLAGCANSKTFIIAGKSVKVEPYGWANSEANKNDSIVYEVNAGNVFWSIIGCETIVVPVWLTGWQFYEPIRKK